jgi:hypothetical protein
MRGTDLLTRTTMWVHQWKSEHTEKPGLPYGTSTESKEMNGSAFTVESSGCDLSLKNRGGIEDGTGIAADGGLTSTGETLIPMRYLSKGKDQGCKQYQCRQGEVPPHGQSQLHILNGFSRRRINLSFSQLGSFLQCLKN